MKITPLLKAEIEAVMKDYWESYFRGDYDRWASYLPDHYHNIGTTKEEIWKSKKEIIDYTHRLSTQMVGNADFRNKATEIISYDPFVMVHEIGDLYVKAEEGWVFYAVFRLSSLLSKERDGWKILHQHGSFPDSKADEGEAFGISELKIENKRLQDAISRRTKEVEEKNRELEIEAALERIRSTSMAMHKTEDISQVVTVFFQQLKKLNIHFVQSWINVFHLEKGYFDIWFSPLENIYNDPQYFQMPSALFEETTIKSWRAGNKFSYLSLNSKEEVEGLFNVCDQITNSTYFQDLQKVLQLERLEFLDANYKYGAVSKSGNVKATQEEEEILHRFAMVFEQTYTRFLDLQKAEKQAREAQIETSLESVRAASMAMHRSEELSGVISVLFKQFDVLDINPAFAHLTLFDGGDESFTLRLTDTSGDRVMKEQRIYMKHMPAWIEAYEAWKSGDENAVGIIHYKPEELVFVLDLMDDLIKAMPSKSRIKIENYPDGLWTVQGHCKFGYLGMNIDRPPRKEDQKIVGRFSKEFGRIYHRFQELQKAEAQAKKANLEAALERVRSRSMAMHQSDELREVIKVILDQLSQLDVFVEHAGFIIDYKERDDMFIWLADKNEIVQQVTIPYFDSPHWNSFLKARDKGERFFANHLDFETKNQFYSKLFEITPELSDTDRTFYLNCKGLAISTVLMENVGLYIENFSGIPYTDDENKILSRFGNVFQQSYTRFLDLQKAEQQTKRIAAINRENERLLHSILPEKIAEQIRNGQQRVVKRFEEVSILFADIVGFTVLSDKLSPDKVVDILNGLFSLFDDLTDKYSLEKIKTIGDAYMVAAGVPNVKANHAHTMFQFAQDMLIALQEFNQQNNIDLNLRIGISSGPVVAGVIGKKKFAYDLWGDTVNTAARMEAYGKEGRIQVSPPCYEILKNHYKFKKIPNVPIKGKGKMDVFLWEGL